MDDYDGSIDYKGNSVSDGFIYLKPWFGGQDVISISGKYRIGSNVKNGRPLVFISNYEFNERFPNEKNRKYIKDCGATIVDLGENDLFTKPNYKFKSIGEWCQNEVLEFDTRETWWYKNIVLPNLKGKTAATEEVVVLESQRTCDIEENEVQLIESNDENEEGRPEKRRIEWVYAEQLPGYEGQLEFVKRRRN